GPGLLCPCAGARLGLELLLGAAAAGPAPPGARARPRGGSWAGRGRRRRRRRRAGERLRRRVRGAGGRPAAQRPASRLALRLAGRQSRPGPGDRIAGRGQGRARRPHSQGGGRGGRAGSGARWRSRGARGRAGAPQLGPPVRRAEGAAGGRRHVLRAGQHGLEEGSDPKWEYRKGIEGMSLGSLQYEMMTTTKDSKEFKRLESEFEKGWGFGFVEITPRAVAQSLASGSKALGLDAALLALVNLLQTLGLEGVAGDGIPVRSEWVGDVQPRTGGSGSSGDQGAAGEGTRSVIDYVVTGQMEKITGLPMPVFLEQHGGGSGLYKIVVGPRSVVVTCDPVVIKHILAGPPEKYTRGILSEVFEPIVGSGLIPAGTDASRVRRRAIVPGFQQRWLESVTETMARCTDALCEDLDRQISQAHAAGEAGALVNMEEKFTSVSFDVIGKAVFEYDFGAISGESPILQAASSVLRESKRRAQSVFPYWNLPGAAALFKDQKSHKENLTLLNAMLDELVRSATEEAGKGTDAAKGDMSMMQFLVQTRSEDVVTQRQLRDDLMTLLIEGHETTAALLTWTMNELMRDENSSALEAVQKEIADVLGCRRITHGDIEKLPFLRACLSEALRLYPEPPLLIRRCVEGDECPVGPLCGMGDDATVRFLPGQDIFISTWSLHRSTDLWGEDAGKFHPWRWERKIEGLGRWAGYDPDKARPYPSEAASDFAFLPFAGGSWTSVRGRPVRHGSGGRGHGEPAAEVHPRAGRASGRPGGAGRQRPGRPPPREAAAAPGLPARPRGPAGGAAAERGAAAAGGLPAEGRRHRGAEGQAGGHGHPHGQGAPGPVPGAQARMDVPTNQDEIDAAYLECQEVTREYSKTFYLGSQLLGDAEQRAVWAIYNWCRCTDELVDGPAAATTTMEDLEAWERTLQQIFDLKETGNSMDLAMIDSVRNFRLIPRPFQDMVGGMALDLVKERYETFAELEVYCYRVAGTVGLMCLPILGFDPGQNYSDDLKDATVDAALCLGLALQLTNILRDVGEDARRGRIYVPLEDLRMFGIDEEDIFQASEGRLALWQDERWKQFMEFQMARCNGYYEKAKGGIIGLTESNRLGVMAALNVYGGILDKIRRNRYDNFTQRAYVSLSEKFGLMAKSWFACLEIQRQADENVRLGNIFQEVKMARSKFAR
ncbi:unnamed protein product, partial [Prorocentrum cordatum]